MNWKNIFAAGTILLSGAFSVHALDPVEIAKLMASDGGTGDQFGRSLAVDGGTIVITAPGGDGLDFNSGAAYVLAWGGTSWAEQDKLTAGDGEVNDFFGGSVALDGGTVVIGSYLDDDLGEDSGSAYVFAWDGMDWVEEAKLTANDGAAGDYFGYAVAIDGDIIAIGAWRDDDLGESSGSVYVFAWDGMSWVEQTRLTASDGAAHDDFGRSVAVEDDVIVVGSHGYSDSGAVYIFNWDGTNWIEHSKLTASEGSAGDCFGYSVAADPGKIIVGDTCDNAFFGSAYVFESDGMNWIEQAKLIRGDEAAYESFGYSVAVDGDHAVVGARSDNSLGAWSGSAYVFSWDGADWVEQAKLTASDAAAQDQYGYKVAVDGGTVYIGSHRDDNLGSAYVYSLLSSETLPGEDVSVLPPIVDETDNLVMDAPDIKLTFDSVSGAGETTVTVTEDGPLPPGGFELMGTDGSATYIDIDTTASFDGMVEICITYSGFDLAVDPASLSLAHIVGADWIDITTSNDLISEVLCGLTSSFSFFAVVHVPDPEVLLADLYVAISELDAKREIKVSLASKLAKIERLMEKDDLVGAASDMVNKFIPKVQKYSDKHVTASQADDLVRRATELTNVLLF